MVELGWFLVGLMFPVIITIVVIRILLHFKMLRNIEKEVLMEERLHTAESAIAQMSMHIHRTSEITSGPGATEDPLQEGGGSSDALER